MHRLLSKVKQVCNSRKNQENVCACVGGGGVSRSVPSPFPSSDYCPTSNNNVMCSLFDYVMVSEQNHLLSGTTVYFNTRQKK